VALVLVALADAVLLGRALQPPEPDPSALVVEAIDDVPTPVASATPVPSTVALAPTARLLVALDDRVAWRTDTVGCGDGTVSVERSADAGATWEAVSLTDAAGVLALVPGSDEQTLSAVLAAADCTALTRTSFTGGSFWRRDDVAPSAAVYLDPADPSRGRAPGGTWIPTPCDAVAGFAALDDHRATVLCVDAGLRLTSDAGASWTRVEGVAEPRAVAASGDGYWVAARGSDCAGVLLVRVDPTGGTADGACTAVEPGAAIALAAVGDAVWVWGTTVEVVTGAR
jgi:hypothetical protein